ncbi:hypothetical protein [Stieleria varia]|nr:hypothetical protein [Stieleria varia]
MPKLLLPLLAIWILLGQMATAADVLVGAFSGQPYGVATIEIPLPVPLVGQTPPPLDVRDAGLAAGGGAGRIVFPIANDVRVRMAPPSEQPVPQPGRGRLLGRLGNLIREIAGNNPETDQLVSRRVTFLFRGTEPMQVRLSEANQEIGVYEIRPTVDQAAHAQLMASWWEAYTAAAKRQIDAGDYPPWVENYLVAVLAGHTGMPLPAWYTETKKDEDPLIATLKLMFGAEGISEEVFRQTAAGSVTGSGVSGSGVSVSTRSSVAAKLPVPQPPKWMEPQLPEIGADVQTEPLASLVPPECFYIRYGSFPNYLWFRDLTEEYGGDLSRMVTLRGIENLGTERVETQLNMKMTQMTRLLGPTVIEDQALIGRDLFLNEGATIGVVIKARNVFLLRNSINGDRKTLAASDPSVTLKDVTVGKHTVSLLSSADNRIRSFLAEHDEYILVTNSKTLTARFLEVAENGKSLGATEHFRLSRSLVPLDRQDTIFAYFSPEMLQGLVSPEYLIELRRRMHALSDISLVHLARLAAAAGDKSAGSPDNTATQEWGIDELVAGGYLPTNFGVRPDGSGVIALDDEIIDTLRGARGTFLPVADVPLKSVTQVESQWYSEIANEYSTRFPQMDPIMIALRRQDVAGDDELERVAVHAEIAPLVPEKYGKWAQQLGPPTKVAMRFAPDDIVSLQAHVASEALGPPTHLFAGIKDTVPPAPEQFDGILGSYRALQQLPGYLGAWPQPGAIDRLPLGLGKGRPVGPGMTRLLGGLYRYTGGGFSIVSFQNDVLTASLPFLEATEVDDVATARAHVGSLLGSQLESWVNGQLYERARKSSLAGANFLNLLVRQMQVKPDAAKEVAARILGANLQCGLGGQYEYSAANGRWLSTAWGGPVPAEFPPGDYVAPALQWFRGCDATATQYADRLVADVNLIIKRQ